MTLFADYDRDAPTEELCWRCGTQQQEHGTHYCDDCLEDERLCELLEGLSDETT